MKYLCTALTVVSALIFLTTAVWGQSTYTWNVASGDWTAAGSWNPARNTPAVDDILVFDGSSQSSPAVTLVPNRETIGRLRIINNAVVTFSTSTGVNGTGTISRSNGSTTVTGTGTTFTTFFAVGDYIATTSTPSNSVITNITDDTHLTTAESSLLSSLAFIKAPIITITGNQPGLDIQAGSSLTISSATPTVILLKTGATGTVGGSITFANGSHRLIGTDASSITFSNGSTFTTNTSGYGGNAFGVVNAVTNNNIIFASGSTYISGAGANPFGASQPSSVVTFQAGSLYSHQQVGTPSFSGRTYANVEINFAATLTVTGANAVSLNNLTLTAGNLNFNMTATPGHSIKGNISVASGSTLSFAPASAGTVNLNGTSTQTISGSGTINTTSNSTLVINNSNGIVLNTPITVNGTLTLTSGNISTGSNTLSAATISGGSSSSYVNGSLAFTFAGTGSKTYPIGTSAAYRPVTLNATAITGSGPISVKQTDASPGNTSLPGTIDKISAVRYWTLTLDPGITNLTGNVTLTWGADDNVSDLTHVTVVQGTAGGAWVAESSAGGTTGDASSGTVTGNGFSSGAGAGDFTFGNLTGGTNPLPVELVSFAATGARTSALLTWKTATEKNCYGFKVERRIISNLSSHISNSQWSKVGFVKGSGTSNVQHSYSYTDANVAPGRYAYRINQIDNDGSSTTYNAAEVQVGLAPKELSLTNYPNPFNPSTRIEFSVPADGQAVVKVFNMLGQEVAKLFDSQVQAGQYHWVQFDGAKISSGVYYYTIEFGGQRIVKRMLMLK